MKLYTASELANYFRVSTAQILKLRKSGKLPYYQPSKRQYRFDLEEAKKVFRGAE